MFCTNCGNEIKEGTLFCTECGTPAPKIDGAPTAEPVKAKAPAPAAQPVAQVSPTNEPAPKKKNTGLIIAIVAIIVALILGGGAFFLVSSGVIDFEEIFSSSDKDDDDDDDKDKDDKDKDDEDEDDEDAAVEDTSAVVEDERDAYGLVEFDNADEALIVDTITAYIDYCDDEYVDSVTLIYYNNDNVPELYNHVDDVLVYIINEDCDVEEMSNARSTLLVYGLNVTNFVQSATVEDAYLVLTDPNYILNADYILPTSHTEYLTKDDLAGLTKEQLRIARNEIFARHGRMFDSADLQEYFNSKDWYTPLIPADEFNLELMLNDIEKANADLIKEVEAEMGN